MYRTLFYVNIYRSYKLLKQSGFLAHPLDTPRIHSYTCRGIKIGALKMHSVCIFSISGIIAKYLQNI